jgi:hypothetical protein
VVGGSQPPHRAHDADIPERDQNRDAEDETDCAAAGKQREGKHVEPEGDVA